MDSKTYEKEINLTDSSDKLSQLEVKYLGRNGVINDLLKKIKDIPSDEKKDYGQKVNKLKTSIKRLIEVKKKELAGKKSEKFFDATLPGKIYPKGSLHPITYTIEEIASIFQKLGFIRVSYPEVEWEYFSFEALNMPKGHPARDDFESFFRTHDVFVEKI